VSGSPAAPSSPGSASASPPASPRRGPAVVVHKYFAAINQGNYARAWRLGGSNFGSTYAAYVAGFQGTVNDVVTIISVSGSVVTADLAALQSDGTTKNFEGTYTVIDGVIAKSSVHQVS
jgi:eukaryotic-like serine/threonine-protein kinase